MAIRYFKFADRPAAVVDFHHEVLIPWSCWRREFFSETPFEAVVFDHHTDVLSNPDFPGRPGEWQEAAAVEKAVENLRHDEQFCWALKSGLASRIKIVSHLPSATVGAAGLSVRCPADYPDEFTQLNRPEIFRPYAENMLSDICLKELLPMLPSAPFILDFDCDAIFCGAALRPRPDTVWRQLLKRAAGFTVALESDYVRLLKLPNEDALTAEAIATELLRQFAASAAPGN